MLVILGLGQAKQWRQQPCLQPWARTLRWCAVSLCDSCAHAFSWLTQALSAAPAQLYCIAGAVCWTRPCAPLCRLPVPVGFCCLPYCVSCCEPCCFLCCVPCCVSCCASCCASCCCCCQGSAGHPGPGAGGSGCPYRGERTPAALDAGAGTLAGTAIALLAASSWVRRLYCCDQMPVASRGASVGQVKGVSLQVPAQHYVL
jgi:hypothetical protein